MDINQAYKEVENKHNGYSIDDPILKMYSKPSVNSNLGEPTITNSNYRKVLKKDATTIMESGLQAVSEQNKLNIVDVVYTDNSDLKENYMMKYELAERKIAPNIKFDDKIN